MSGSRRVVAAVLVFAAGLAGTHGQAAVILDSLRIRVYDNAGVLAAYRSRAIKQATEILGRAGMAVQWHDCSARAALIKTPCAAPAAGGELVVRLVRSPKRHANDRALGHAYIDTVTGAGTLATVFVDRVESLAAYSKADRWILVGRVMAHGIGHLLLGSDAHSDRGLMREIWNVKELTRNRPEDWLFSGAQRDDLRQSRPGGKSGPNATMSGPLLHGAPAGG